MLNPPPDPRHEPNNHAANALELEDARRAARLFRSLAESSPALLWAMDATGQCTWVNRRWTEVTGVPSEELLGEGWHKVLHDDDADAVRRDFCNAAIRGEPCETEFRIKSGGRYCYYAGRGASQLDDEGQVLGYAGVATNIDASRRLEDALRAAVEIRVGRAAEQTLRALCEAMTNVFGVAFAGIARLFKKGGEDWAHMVAGWHAGSEAPIFEYSLYGTPCGIAATKEYCRVNQGVVGEFPEDQLLEDMGAVGYAGLRIYDSAGVPIGLLVILDEKPLDAQVDLYPTMKLFGARAASELERDRTEAHLRGARERAEASSTAKSEFLATMSHEFRTPLNGVLGTAQLLWDTDLSENQREYAATIQQSGSALLHIVNDILDFSEIEAGRLQIERVRMDLWDVIEQVTLPLLEEADKRGNALGLFLHPNVPRVLSGDPARLRQVLENLCANALQFTEAGDVSVHARVDGPFLRIEVCDTGCGIPPTALPQLFDPFTQVDGSTTRSHGGTGLGLAICKRLVAMMGGEIGVDSEAGVGSRFWLTLPMDLSPEGDGSPANFAGPLPRVLCLSRGEPIRQVLVAHLEQAQAEVLASPNLASVPEHASEPDIVLVESEFGMDELRKVRKAYPQAALVLLEPATAPLDEADAVEILVTDRICTPLRASELIPRLANVLSRIEPAALLPSEPALEDPAPATWSVLVVEDNPVNQRIAKAILTGLGCRVDVANNGLEGVEVARHSRYDVIFMDCQMPVMDGYQATRTLRSEETNPPRYIVALTANAMPCDRAVCLAAGMDDYLTKPIDKRALGELLKQRARHSMPNF